MKKRIEDFTVTENRRMTEELFLLTLKAPGQLPEIRAGQFAQIKVSGNEAPLLRRPFSFHDVDHTAGTLSLLIQIAGTGTRLLSQLMPGDTVNMLYPLGKPFTLPKKNEKVILAGGGSGVAPLLLLGKEIAAVGATPHYALGFRDSSRIFDLSSFSAVGMIDISTEDGSQGYKGFVTDIPALKNRRRDKVYCCGPEPMMRSVAAICRQTGTACEVSLENLMACGVGVCLCCIVPTTSGNLCTCTEGPVFNINELTWQT